MFLLRTQLRTVALETDSQIALGNCPTEVKKDLGYRGVLKEMGIPEHLTCLLRNLYAGQEATVRTGHGTTDWFQIGKGIYVKAVYCHPAYLTYMQSTS